MFLFSIHILSSFYVSVLFSFAGFFFSRSSRRATLSSAISALSHTTKERAHEIPQKKKERDQKAEHTYYPIFVGCHYSRLKSSFSLLLYLLIYDSLSVLPLLLLR